MEVLPHCSQCKRHDNSTIITDLWNQSLGASNFGPGRGIVSVNYIHNMEHLIGVKQVDLQHKDG